MHYPADIAQQQAVCLLPAMPLESKASVCGSLARHAPAPCGVFNEMIP